ncbi:MAG: hypothetical protein DWP95_13305, partial [Proteobacteria bacterium]
LISGVFIQSHKLTASDGTNGDHFGASISQFGDRAVIGAPFDDDVAYSSGSAYVFDFDSMNWSQTQKLKALDAAQQDSFGLQTSLTADRILIGAYFDDDNGIASGSAYVFELNSGVWSQVQKLTADDASANNFFGSAVSVDNNRAMIGAFMADGESVGSGAVYVFDLIAGTWVQSQKIFASDGEIGDRFGNAISLLGHQVLIGSLYDDVYGIDTGSAYLFELSDNFWFEKEKIIPADGMSRTIYGSDVSLSAEQAMIGAPFDNERGANSGSVYMFDVRGFILALVPSYSVASLCLLIFFLLGAVFLIRPLKHRSQQKHRLRRYPKRPVLRGQ